jgi:hypothetical protein
MAKRRRTDNTMAKRRRTDNTMAWLPLCNLQTFLYGLPTANLHNLFETYVVADEYFYMFAIFVDNTLNVLKGTKYIHLC